MQCISPVYLSQIGRMVPCGKCSACRVNYSTMWSTRLTQELAYHKSALFLTLTYNNKHLIYSVVTQHPTLYKRHWQLFVKRLRKRLGNRKISYFCSGEYGETTGRPHYHAIIFGLSNKECDRKLIRECWPLCDEVGRHFGSVTYDSCRYVSDYILKYPKSRDDKKMWSDNAMEPPFSVISNGIGLKYALDHKDAIERSISVPNDKGHKVPLPRYYADKLGLQRKTSVKHYLKILYKYKGHILQCYPKLTFLYDLSEEQLLGYLSVTMSTRIVSPVQQMIHDYMQQYYVPARQAKARKAQDLAERKKNKKIF